MKKNYNLYNIVDRVSIHGSGFWTPVIFLHGMEGPELHSALYYELSENYTVYVPTLPGFKETDGKVKYDDRAYCDFLFEVIKEFRIRSCYLIGYSLGARIALNFSIRHPTFVDNLVLMSCPGVIESKFFNRPILNKLLKMYFFIKSKKHDYTQLYLKYLFVSESKLIYERTQKTYKKIVNSSILRKNFFEVYLEICQEQHNWSYQLHDIDIPTLLLWGREDSLCPIEAARLLHSELRNSSLVLFESLKHGGILECPYLFLSAIQKFLP